MIVTQLIRNNKQFSSEIQSFTFRNSKVTSLQLHAN